MGSYIFEEYFDKFVYYCRLSGRSSSTIVNYTRSITRLHNYIRAHNYGQESTEPADAIINAYLLWGRDNRSWSRYTIWTEYKNLKAYFTWPHTQKLTKWNPFILIPKPKQPETYPKSLHLEDISLVWEVMASLSYRTAFTKARNYAMIATLLYTGIRKAELMNLCYSDVDIETGFIFIKKGKGDKSREIPIEAKSLLPLLTTYVKERNLYFSVEGRFFLNSYSSVAQGENLSEQALVRIFRVLSRHTGKRIHAHMLRHTFATQLLEETGDIYTIKELMGHTDIKTTTIYLSTSRRKKIQTVNSLKLPTAF